MLSARCQLVTVFPSNCVFWVGSPHLDPAVHLVVAPLGFRGMLQGARTVCIFTLSAVESSVQRLSAAVAAFGRPLTWRFRG